MKGIILRVCLLFFALALGAAAQPLTSPPGPQYTLKECLQKVATANPTLIQARARLQQAQASVEQVYVGLNPTLTTTVSYSRTILPVSPPSSGFTNFINSLIPGILPSNKADPDTFSVGLALQQTVFTFGKLRWTALVQKLNEKKVQQDYRSSLLGLLQQAEKAYVTVKASEARLELVERRRQLRADFLQVARNRFKAGLIAEFELIQSQTQMESADLDLIQAQLERDTARTALFILMGEPVQAPASFVALGELEEPPASVDESLKYALEHRPEMASLRWSLASAQANVEAARLNNAPSLSIYSQYMATQVPGQTAQPSWAAGMQLNIPFYDGGMARAMTHQAEGVVNEVRGSLGAQGRVVENDVRSQFLRLRSLKRQIEQATAVCKGNDVTVQIALNRYRAGLSNSTEWFGAQATWTQAQENRIDLESNYRQSLADWRRALGSQPLVELPASALVDWSEPPGVLAPGEKPDESWVEKP